MIPQRSTRRRRLTTSWSPLSVIVSAGLQGLADSLLQPVIILSSLAFLLGGTNYQIASFAVISAACWSLGRFLVDPLVIAAQSTQPIAIAGLILRTGAILLIGAIGYRMTDLAPASTLGGLIVCYFAYELGAMTTTLTTNGQVADAYAPSKRAAIFRWRSIAAAVAALVAGFVAQGTLGAAKPGFPTSGKYLLILASVSVIAATWFLIQVPPRSRQRLGSSHSQSSNGMGVLLRSSRVRRFLAFRLLLGLAALADPFLVVYGLQKIGFGFRFIGLALLFHALLQVIGSVIWPRWIAFRSCARLLQFAAFLRLVFLILAISIPAVANSTVYSNRFDSPQVAAWSFAIVFGLLGLASSIQGTTHQRYLIDVAGPAHPQAIITLCNAMLGMIAFAPLVGALIASRYSLETSITTGGAIAFLAFIASGLLVESRANITRRRGIWRLGSRRARAAS